MSWGARTIGLARSLAVYHGVPGRQRRIRSLYSTLVSPGDLAIDIGAHIGNHTRALARLGCRVIAVEPQPDFAALLRLMFSRTGQVSVIEAAIGRAPGRATLAVSDCTPTVTTVSRDWLLERQRDPAFRSVHWNRTIDVAVLTVDELASRHGCPAFVKIDAEGAELDVLEGLTSVVPVLSFEYLPLGLDRVTRCVSRLAALGTYRFNWSVGETFRLASREWLDGPSLLRALEAPGAPTRSGDVYARAHGHGASSRS